MNRAEVIELLRKYEDGTISREDRALLESWYINEARESKHQLSADAIEESFNYLSAQFPVKAGKTFKLWPRIAVAAAAVAAITVGVWLYTNEIASSRNASRNTEVVVNDIAPGKQGATLTLANGQVIQLSDQKAGVIVGDNKLVYDDGSLVGRQPDITGRQPDLGDRHPDAGQDPGPAMPTSSPFSSGVLKRVQDDDGVNSGGSKSVLLTAQTAKGQTYQFTLPDGTKVWLNAASSIKFPSAFSGKDRVVELTGEAYFEVSKITSPLSPQGGSLPKGARGARMPFLVKSRNQEVEVLGTHFNINAYADEKAVRTTLLEGSVKVSAALRNSKSALQGVDSKSGVLTPKELRSKTVQDDDRFKQGDDVINGESRAGSLILKPGQQSILNEQSAQVLPADTEEALSWKNGYFRFNNEPIESVMQKIARWYNIDVQYEGKVPVEGFYGTISRYKNISEVLTMLEQTKGVRFKVEGRRVTVRE